MIKLLAVLVAALCTPKTAVLDIKQTDELLGVSVVIRAKVYNGDPIAKDVKRGLVGCSGTYIGPTTVLTAAHCFSYPSTNIWVRGSDGESREARLERSDVERDLALLSIKKKYRHLSAVLAKSVRVGEVVYNVGSPFSLEFLVSDGIVAQIGKTVKQSKATYLVTTAMINSGSSGGGAFNDKGELIGVNTMTYGGLFGWAGISLAVDRDTIEKFLKTDK